MLRLYYRNKGGKGERAHGREIYVERKGGGAKKEI